MPMEKISLSQKNWILQQFAWMLHQCTTTLVKWYVLNTLRSLCKLVLVDKEYATKQQNRNDRFVGKVLVLSNVFNNRIPCVCEAVLIAITIFHSDSKNQWYIYMYIRNNSGLSNTQGRLLLCQTAKLVTTALGKAFVMSPVTRQNHSGPESSMLGLICLHAGINYVSASFTPIYKFQNNFVL